MNLREQKEQGEQKMHTDYNDEDSSFKSTSRLSENIIQSTMSRIRNFLQMQLMRVEQFWRSDRNHASASDIAGFCRACGLRLTQLDETNLKAQLFANRQTISLEQFCTEIPCWKKEQNQQIIDFLRKRSNLLIEKIQSKQSNHKVRPKTGGALRPASSVTQMPKAITKLNHAQANNSVLYLKKYKEKALSQEKLLNEAIDKNKSDYEYQMLLKMSELNQYNKNQANQHVYRAFKSAEGIIRVRVFKQNISIKEITLNQFDTIYKNYKKKINYNKEWATTVVKRQEEELKKSKTMQKAQRQQELKNLLANTINLTNVLKEQIKIFKMKGIYGSQTNS